MNYDLYLIGTADNSGDLFVARLENVKVDEVSKSLQSQTMIRGQGRISGNSGVDLSKSLYSRNEFFLIDEEGSSRRFRVSQQPNPVNFANGKFEIITS